MRRKNCNITAFGLALLCLLGLTACGASQDESVPEAGTHWLPIEHTYTPAPEESDAELTVFVPTEDQVVALRELVEEGMTQEEVDVLVEFFISCHRRVNNVLGSPEEQAFFTDLLDPYDKKWNYFDQTGEIRVADNVVDYNEHDAYWFADRLAEQKASVKSGMLDADFDRMIELCISAADHHRAEDAKELFQMIHDLDFYLLRYGPVNALGARDLSVLKTYYDSLSIWSEEARAERAQEASSATP